MDLSTSYMGLKIKNPLVVSSSGLTGSIENIKKCEDNGAGAVVLKSLFEEQLLTDKSRLMNQDEMYFWYPETMDYLDMFSKEEGITAYLKLIENSRKSVNIPVIASINCVSPKEWPAFAKKLEEAGADGLELNIYIPPTNIDATGYKMEETYIDIVHEVRRNVDLPLAVKIGYFFTNIIRTLFRLGNTEIQSLVLFNRYYRPDIDIEKLQLISNNVLSSPEEITQSLRWIALMYEKVRCELIATTGIHDYTGVVKQLLAGASAVQLCSTLYKNGIEYLQTINNDLENWMKQKGYTSISNFQGLISKQEESKEHFERLQFMQKTTGRF
jgi:dihydroorotate dehydrogenase (fumarate)